MLPPAHRRKRQSEHLPAHHVAIAAVARVAVIRDIMVPPAPARSTAWKTTLPSVQRGIAIVLDGAWARQLGCGPLYSDFYSLWGFSGTTPNYSAYMDLGTLAPATTPHWFDAYSPTTLKQQAAFGDATYGLTDALKVDVGGRVNHYDYRFSSCLSGWGSANGAATPSCSGLIALVVDQLQPETQSLVHFQPGDDGVCNRVDRLPSRRGQRGLSDHRCRLGLGLPAAKLYERQVALHLRAGPCPELRAGRKARFLDQRVT